MATVGLHQRHGQTDRRMTYCTIPRKKVVSLKSVSFSCGSEIGIEIIARDRRFSSFTVECEPAYVPAPSNFPGSCLGSSRRTGLARSAGFSANAHCK